MSPREIEDRDYTVGEAARLLGVKPTAIHEAIRRGSLRGTHKKSTHGTPHAIPAASLIAYDERRRRSSLAFMNTAAYHRAIVSPHLVISK